MKKAILFSLFALYSAFSIGQTITVTGTVNSSQGQPVPFAFIRDVHHNYATYADSAGNYQIKADPASTLMATADGYMDVSKKIDNAPSVNFALTGGGATSGGGATNAFRANTVYTDVLIGGQKTRAYETQGSRYLFADWVHGYAISPDDSLKQNPKYLFNYDKIGGVFIVTQDRKAINQVSNQDIKTLKLFDSKGQEYDFQMVAAIDNTHYVQVLASGSKYGIYKKVDTKLVYANFTTNGLNSSGNKYDEFVDDYTYYVIKAGGQPQKFNLKKKGIKEAFAADADKVAKFMSANSGDINDGYLVSLGDAINQ